MNIKSLNRVVLYMSIACDKPDKIVFIHITISRLSLTFDGLDHFI